MKKLMTFEELKQIAKPVTVQECTQAQRLGLIKIIEQELTMKTISPADRRRLEDVLGDLQKAASN